MRHLPTYHYSIYHVLILFVITTLSFHIHAQNIEEGFENVDSLFTVGWVRINNSDPGGAYGAWQQDNGNFIAQSGSPNSSIICDYTSVNGNGTISNWLLTPEILFTAGDTLFFWTRSYANIFYPDRLEIRLSTTGNSTEVGSDKLSTGVFNTLIYSINPDLDTATNTYPMGWKRYALPIPSSANGLSGRIAFRYFITNGGVSGINGSTIGIDNLYYQSVLTGIEETASLIWNIYPNPTSRIVYVEATSEAQYKLCSLSGQVVLQGLFSNGTNTIDLTGLAPSTYFIYLTLENGKQSIRQLVVK